MNACLKLKAYRYHNGDPSSHSPLFNIIVLAATSGSTSKSSTDDDPAYVYDYRGLKVRKDSLSRVQPEEQEEEEQRAKKNKSNSPGCPHTNIVHAHLAIHVHAG